MVNGTVKDAEKQSKTQSHNSVGKWLILHHHFEIVKENPWCKFRCKGLCVKYDAKRVSEKCEGSMCGCYSTDEAPKVLPSLRIKGDIDIISGQKKKRINEINEILPRPKEHQAKEF